MFSIEEIDVLLEALDAWTTSGLAGALMESMLSSVVSDSREEVQAQAEAHMAKVNQEARDKKERAILLSAKLITLKNKIEAGEAAEFLAEGGS